MLVAAGCGGGLSATEIQQRSDRADARATAALEHARDGYLAAHHLHLVAGDGQRTDGSEHAADATAAGVAPGEALVTLADGRLAFRYPSRCGCSGCDTSIQYAVAAGDDGAAVVLRLRATDHVTELRQEGSCTVGCGTPMPPEPPLALALPARDPAHVHVVEVRYDRDVVHVRCAKEIPAP
ncbi:MAG: hypothetical protein ACM31C_32610 [Acidobacteriota bacterium]